MNKINIVTSYINPDTDGIACSIAMAKMLSVTEEQWFPVTFGSIGDETKFVLQSLEISAPKTLLSFADVDQIMLVDTHHASQLPQNFPFEKVITIIDHHPNGDDGLFPSATITNEKVGAAASIVAKSLFEQHLTDPVILRLLGFAILSNTLNFSAPSTTEFDREIYDKIESITPISENLINGMFEQRSAILKKDIYTALCADFKVFDTKSGKVGIAQIEAYDLETLIDASKAIPALARIADEKGLDLCFFNGVDIKAKCSIVLAANHESANLLCRIFKLDSYEGPQRFDRILLRKTDFVPPMNV